MINLWYIFLFLIILAIIFSYKLLLNKYIIEGFEDSIFISTKEKKDEKVFARAYEDKLNDVQNANFELDFKQVPLPPRPTLYRTTTPPPTTPPPPPENCKYSKWGSWSACTNKCGVGTQTRKRKVIEDEKNGGKCDRTENALIQKQPCYSSMDCKGVTTEPPENPVNGLFFMIYSGYHNENPTHDLIATKKLLSKSGNDKGYAGITSDFDNISNAVNKFTDVNGLDTDFTVVWTGYLYTKREAGIWTFWTNSNDGSYFWIGDEANSGYTIENASINNGGTGDGMREVMVKIDLKDNTYYPVRIMYGQYQDRYDFQFAFKTPKSRIRQTFGGDYLVTASPKPINCTYSEWSGNYDECTAKCGGGTYTKKRTVMFGELYYGKCDRSQNTLISTESCNTDPCPIDCSYSWKGWTSCDFESGTKTNDISINIPAQYGGQECPPTQKVLPCPVDCSYIWDDWDYCDVNFSSASYGFTTRNISTTEPKNNGLPCTTPPKNQTLTSCIYMFDFKNSKMAPEWSVSYYPPTIESYGTRIFVGNATNNEYGFNYTKQTNRNFFGVMFDDTDGELTRFVSYQPAVITIETSVKLDVGKYKLEYTLQSRPYYEDLQLIGVHAFANGQSNPIYSFKDPVKGARKGLAVPQILTFDVLEKDKGYINIGFNFVYSDHLPSINVVALYNVTLSYCSPINGKCSSDAKFLWSDWGECDKTYGIKQRVPIILVDANNGGKTADQLYKKGTKKDVMNNDDYGDDLSYCVVNCEYSWKDWTECTSDGIRTRDPDIKYKSKNGGKACPTTETEQCDFDCVYSYIFTDSNGNYIYDENNKFKEVPYGSPQKDGYCYRTPIVINTSKNNGKSCPVDSKECPIDCTYETVSKDQCEDDGFLYTTYKITGNKNDKGKCIIGETVIDDTIQTHKLKTATCIRDCSYDVKNVRCDTDGYIKAKVKITTNAIGKGKCMVNPSEYAINIPNSKGKNTIYTDPIDITNSNDKEIVLGVCPIDCEYQITQNGCKDGIETITINMNKDKNGTGTCKYNDTYQKKEIDVINNQTIKTADCQDCVEEYNAWSACDPNTMTQTRTVNNIKQPTGKGTPCKLTNESHNCSLPSGTYRIRNVSNGWGVHMAPGRSHWEAYLVTTGMAPEHTFKTNNGSIERAEEGSGWCIQIRGDHCEDSVADCDQNYCGNEPDQKFVHYQDQTLRLKHDSNRCLDFKNHGSNGWNGTKYLTMKSCDGSDYQKWRLE